MRATAIKAASCWIQWKQVPSLNLRCASLHRMWAACKWTSTAHHDGSVDAFACEGVNVPRSIAHNDEVIVVGRQQALPA